MSNEQLKQHSEKAGGPAIGNAIAYFVVILWAESKGYIDPEQSETAVLMAGAIIGSLIMYLRQIARWVGKLIEKIADRSGKG